MSNPIEELRRQQEESNTKKKGKFFDRFKPKYTEHIATGSFKVIAYGDAYLTSEVSMKVKPEDKVDVYEYKDGSMKYLKVNGNQIGEHPIIDIVPSLLIQRVDKDE